MTKVTIPHEVAGVIELLRKGGIGCPPRDNAYICELWMRTGGGVPIATDVLRKIPFDTLMAALVNGYEREMTGEERVATIFRELCEAGRTARSIPNGNPSKYSFTASVVVNVLNALEIKIEGVNA